jgi:hypothetical protein
MVFVLDNSSSINLKMYGASSWLCNENKSNEMIGQNKRKRSGFLEYKVTHCIRQIVYKVPLCNMLTLQLNVIPKGRHAPVYLNTIFHWQFLSP